MIKDKKIPIAVAAIFIVLIAGLITFSSIAEKKFNSKDFAGNYAFAKAKVEEITYDDTNTLKNNDDSVKQAKQEFQITILDTNHKGERYKIRNTVEALDVHKIVVSNGDEILVNYTVGSDGMMNSIHLYEIVRDKYIYLLIFIFIGSLILICGKKGVKATISLCLLGLMIVKVLMPIILAGYSPLFFTIVVCIITSASIILFVNGINKKALVSIIGTIGGIIIAAIIAVLIGKASKVTGLTGNETQMLAFTNKSMILDYRAILFSSIIIGALGAIMDVSVSISASMNELIEIKPDITKKELIKSGMNVGKDIMTTMSNTLILAYAGGGFTMFLLFIAEKVAFTEIMNLEMVTTELITAFSGSIGLVWTIPITVYIMAALFDKKLVRTNKKV